MAKLWVNWFCRCGLTTLDCTQITWNQASKFKQMTLFSSAEVAEYFHSFCRTWQLDFCTVLNAIQWEYVYAYAFSKQDAELTLPLSFQGSESNVRSKTFIANDITACLFNKHRNDHCSTSLGPYNPSPYCFSLLNAWNRILLIKRRDLPYDINRTNWFALQLLLLTFIYCFLCRREIQHGFFSLSKERGIQYGL